MSPSPVPVRLENDAPIWSTLTSSSAQYASSIAAAEACDLSFAPARTFYDQAAQLNSYSGSQQYAITVKGHIDACFLLCPTVLEGMKPVERQNISHLTASFTD